MRTLPHRDDPDRQLHDFGAARSKHSFSLDAGLSQAQIASQLSNPASPVARPIDGSADVIISAIDNVLHRQAGG